MNMNLNRTIATFFVLLFLQLTGTQLISAQEKPNILFIITDDMGYGDLSVTGSKQINTPNIDSLFEMGVSFKQAYVTAPVCAPSRCGLLSGMYQNRFGAEHNWNDFKEFYNSDYVGIDPKLKIISDYIDSNGYATAAIGKWHAGETKAMSPNQRGFDYSFTMGGHHGYFPKAEKNKLKRNGNPVTQIDVPYLTDWWTKEAIDWMTKDHGEEPWFVYLGYNTPHTPLQAKDEDIQKYAHIKDKKRRTYLAMQDCLDQNIGKLLKVLESTNQLDNTIILFTNDNGGPCDANASVNAPFRGQKGIFLEGGLRVPMVMVWNGKIKSGEKYDKPVITLDILPTLVAAIEKTSAPEDYDISKKYPDNKLDGVNLFPYILNKLPKDSRPHQTLYWRYVLRGSVILDGDFKLIMTRHHLPMLYNLANDIQEKNNLLLEMPEKATEMKHKLADWEAGLEATPRFFNKNNWLKRHKVMYHKDYIMDQPE